MLRRRCKRTKRMSASVSFVFVRAPGPPLTNDSIAADYEFRPWRGFKSNAPSWLIGGAQL